MTELTGIERKRTHKQMEKMVTDLTQAVERLEKELKMYRNCDEQHKEMLHNYPVIRDAWEQYVMVKSMTLGPAKGNNDD